MDILCKKQRRVLHGAYCCGNDDSSAVELEQLPNLADKLRIDQPDTSWLQKLLLCSLKNSSGALVGTLLFKKLPS